MEAKCLKRSGDCQQTYTGRRFWPLDPKPEEIDIVDIAWSLSNQCRYLGHTSRFYSVAEHSFWVSHYCLQFPLEGLLHDAAESYLADIPRPLKPFLEGFEKIEENLLKVIFQKFKLVWPLPAPVKRVDTALLQDEQEQLMPFPFPGQWHQTTESAGLGIKRRLGMSSKQAFYYFMDRFKSYYFIDKRLSRV